MEDENLKVNRFLQVEEMNEVFAIGDCNNTPELKTAYVAGTQGGMESTHNLLNYSRQKSGSQKSDLAKSFKRILKKAGQ